MTKKFKTFNKTILYRRRIHHFLDLPHEIRSTITRLDFRWSSLSRLQLNDFTDLINRLIESKTLPQIDTLNLGDHSFKPETEEKVKILSKIFAECTKLTELHFNNIHLNEFSPEAFKCFCEGLLQLNTLTRLNLGWNFLFNLSLENFKLLCDTFTQLPNLVHLELVGYGLEELSPEQLKIFLESFQKEGAPQLLYLEGIENKEIKEMILQNRFLYLLDIKRTVEEHTKLPPILIFHRLIPCLIQPENNQYNLESPVAPMPLEQNNEGNFQEAEGRINNRLKL